MNMKRWVVRLSALTLSVGVITPTTMTVTASEMYVQVRQFHNPGYTQIRNVVSVFSDSGYTNLVDSYETIDYLY